MVFPGEGRGVIAGVGGYRLINIARFYGVEMGDGIVFAAGNGRFDGTVGIEYLVQCPDAMLGVFGADDAAGIVKSMD